MFSKKTINTRISYTKIAIIGFYFLIIIRATMIQLFPRSANLLQNIASQQYQSELNLSPFRGTIYDRRRTPLAISIKSPSIAVNPRIFNPSYVEVKKISQILKLNKKYINSIKRKKNYFAWLKRKVTHSDAEKIKKLKISGIHFLLSLPGSFYQSFLRGSRKTWFH